MTKTSISPDTYLSIPTYEVKVMKAVRIHSYGGSEVLAHEEAPQPVIGDDEVLVKVHAAGVNPVDVATRAGYMQGLVTFQFPFAPGLDLAGVVAAIGPAVTDLAVGDEVYGFSDLGRQGTYAEYAVVTAAEVASKPKTVDFVAAASVPIAGLSAWQALAAADLQAGQTVLVHGAGGGVGSFAVQFARQRGAHVLGTASTDKMDLLQELGVDQAIDYTTTRFEEVAHDVDVVLDTIGDEVLARSWGVLKPGGTLVTLMGQPDQKAATAQSVRGLGIIVQASAADLTEIAGLIDSGHVRSIVSTVLPFVDE
jgi:NADPH:quinone reductase-like Zn-dependent oxidoreductase